MNWHSASEFFHMGGYGLYVWGAYGATLLVMEDIPPPDAWNLAGRMMHWLDRGGFIRTAAEYRALLGPHLAACRTSTMRSGICDYEVYVLERTQQSGVRSQNSAILTSDP